MRVKISVPYINSLIEIDTNINPYKDPTEYGNLLKEVIIATKNAIDKSMTEEELRIEQERKFVSEAMMKIADNINNADVEQVGDGVYKVSFRDKNDDKYDDQYR